MAITSFPQQGSSSNNATYVQFGGGTVDAFDRLRVSNPYTLFDSQSRYASDSAFDSSTVGSGTVTFATNASTTNLNVTTASGDSVVRQTFRTFPYQPGKSFLILATFAMATGKTNQTQRVGYYNTNNGIYFEQAGTTLTIVLRTYTSGSVAETRISQANWNGDKLNGTGLSGITLDVTKTQIFYTDMEWLGVGIVQVGFILNGTYVCCHTFYNANSQTQVYMQTAILNVRYEIFNTGTVASSSTMQQICSTVISEGGYEQASQIYWARMTGTSGSLGNVPTTNIFVPLVTIRLNASHLGAVVLSAQYAVLPISSSNYEVAIIKNATLTSASYNTSTFQNVDYDTSATAMTYTATNINEVSYVTSTSQAKSNIVTPQAYNWDLQLGVSLAGVSDTLTLAVRSIGASGAANSVYGSFGFYDLTL